MVRLCFSRKHKTLGAIFKKDNVVEMVTENYKTYCALNNIVLILLQLNRISNSSHTNPSQKKKKKKKNAAAT